MEKADEFSVVYVTCETYENANQIGKVLVSEKLAACCSIIPNVYSFFSWKGSMYERNEYIIVIKTLKTLLEQLEQRVLEIHTDDVPEIVAFTPEFGLGSYLEWIKNSLSI